MNDQTEKQMLTEGYRPIGNGKWVPQKVQGGYIPKSDAKLASPPKGGSAVKAPPK